MVETTGPLRLTPPSHQLYDTGVGEATILRGINPDTMGAMYGMLLNQRALQDARMGEYGDALANVNQQQRGIAAEKLRTDNLASMRTGLAALVKDGDMSASTALRGMDIPQLQSPYSAQEAQQDVLSTDGSRQRLTEATAYQRAGAGAQSSAEAGLITPEGTPILPGARGNLLAPRTAQGPMDLTAAALRRAGVRSGTGTGEIVSTITNGDVGDTLNFNVVARKGASSTDAYRTAMDLQRLRSAGRDADITAAGGNATRGSVRGSGDANAGTRTNENATPLPRPGNPQSGYRPPTAEQKRAMEGRIGTYTTSTRDPSGRVTHHGTRSSMTE